MRPLKLKTYQLLLLTLLLILLPMTLVITLAQEKLSASSAASKSADDKPLKAVSHRDAHRKEQFYANVRAIPPVNITEIDGNRVYYLFVADGIHIGSLELEPGYSVVPKTLSKDNHGGCYGIYFCEEHKIILDMTELDPKYCQK